MSTFIPASENIGFESTFSDWREIGERTSIGSTQTVMLHTPTETKALITPEGMNQLENDPTFIHFLGRLSTAKHFSMSNIQSLFEKKAPSLRMSRVTAKGWEHKYPGDSTVHSFLEYPQVITKVHDLKKGQNARQFEVMQFIGKSLKKADTVLDVDTPKQFAFLKQPWTRRTAVVSERIHGGLKGDKHSAQLISVVNDTSRTVAEQLRTDLKSALGLGYIFVNDLMNYEGNYHNLIICPKSEAKQTYKYYLIDQPLGRMLDPSKLILPVANALTNLTTPKGIPAHFSRI